MAGLEAGAWRGRIEDGEVVEEHDPGYDEHVRTPTPEPPWMSQMRRRGSGGSHSASSGARSRSSRASGSSQASGGGTRIQEVVKVEFDLKLMLADYTCIWRA
jgi:hypothetical protein